MNAPDSLTLAPDTLSRRYRDVRATTARLCGPLEVEDHIPQSMPDASPVKWHLAHTSWFFETFLLKTALGGKRGVSPDVYGYLFGSYCDTTGNRIARSQRGLLTRPTLSEVRHYRAAVDARMGELLDKAEADPALLGRVAPLVEFGMNHEQRHQEMVLTDVKHLFAANPLRPPYREYTPPLDGPIPPVRWVEQPGGLCEIGSAGPGFAFDHEGPRHRVYLRPFALATRLATCGEYLAFMADGGYDRPELWLSDGWTARHEHGWTAPLYWEREAGEGWQVFTLSGRRDLIESEPVCHVSYYEADAFARWADARLPMETEWEAAAVAAGVEPLGNFLESEQFHPRPLPLGAHADGSSPVQLYGDVWEWTASPYVAYPGFRPVERALGGYDGRSMCNQFVLRGGSCATPRSHIRPTYRNFLPPEARWRFSGIRLAKDS